MIIKNLRFLLAIVLSCTAFAQNDTLSSREWNATIFVTDDAGQPIPGANISVFYSVLASDGTASRKIEGTTDGAGTFLASHKDTGVPAMAFRAKKSGYYSITQSYNLGWEYNRQIWNPTISLVLKQVRNPIAMYAKLLMGNPPITNQPCGFDLGAGDWVYPYGKGHMSDIIFIRKLDQKSKRDYDESLTVSFPNKGDGIQNFYIPSNESGSELASPHEAPITGYQTTVVRRKSRHPGQQMALDFDQNRHYFFRVRTTLDQQGNVTSALYGKIYGDFMHFTYYLNPTPNDRNIEFDPKRNLLIGQNVTAP